MDPEDIVRSLAARFAPTDNEDGYCLFCYASAFASARHSEPHADDCPFRLAVEWVSEHPEGATPPFSPQYDLIGDAEQAQGPDSG